jgi:hypothetical protein
MGYLFSIACFITYFIVKDPYLMIVASIFAVAGAIELKHSK